MQGEKYRADEADHADTMLFGFDRATDEESIAVFLQKIADPDLLAKLVPRLEDQEIESVLHLFTGLMKKHLSKNEFHRLFLDDNK
ncbi:MAG: hypothetical protein ABFS18_04935 [Thermodesulfobacteriota bacterium]